MKRVNPDVLASMALAKGASIKIDGKQINAAGERISIATRPKVAPITERAQPAPAPRPATIDTSGLERAAAAQQSSSAHLVHVVAMLLREVRAKPATEQVREWEFDVERDAYGRLLKIRAFAR